MARDAVALVAQAPSWDDSTRDGNSGSNPWNLALEGSGAGAWDWDLQTGVQSHSKRWLEMLGYDKGEPD